MLHRSLIHVLRVRLARIPEVIWVPVVGAGLLVLPAIFGMIVGRPWLFPSLGPTAFVHVHHPQAPAGRLYNTVVGHGLGLLSAILSLYLCGAAQEPSVMAAGHLFAGRTWASILAIALTLFLQELFGAQHAPAAATTLLISLGALKPNLGDSGTIAAGVLLVAIPGEFVRRIRIRQRGIGIPLRPRNWARRR